MWGFGVPGVDLVVWGWGEGRHVSQMSTKTIILPVYFDPPKISLSFCQFSLTTKNTTYHFADTSFCRFEKSPAAPIILAKHHFAIFFFGFFVLECIIFYLSFSWLVFLFLSLSFCNSALFSFNSMYHFATQLWFLSKRFKRYL